MEYEGRDEMLAKERQHECRWFWLSFADEDRFRGGCFVLAPGIITAIKRAHDLGINPGGEVMGIPVSRTPPPEIRNRLLNKDDLVVSGGWVVIGGQYERHS